MFTKYILLQGIVSCIKKCSEKEISQFHTDDIRAIITHIMIPKAFSHLKVIRSKHFYEKFVEMKDEQSLSSFRLKHRYELSDTELYKARQIMISTTLDIKTREFQLKVLSNILFFNYKLFKMRIKPSPECTFGCKHSETLEHALWQCIYVQTFWNEAKDLLPMLDLSVLDEKMVIVGYLEKHPHSVIINHILLIAKRSIYLCISNKNKPSIGCFKRMLFTSYKEETYVAKRKGKLSFHNEKWNYVLPLFD